MRKREDRKRLVVRRERLRQLTTEQAARVAGGGTFDDGCDIRGRAWSKTCPIR
ncbi:MAG TPA: hypothetical protein VFU21_29710 [Kofleriaceae bacterium]|nr:hypothetical protein [Kofleriaceae bacterium]